MKNLIPILLLCAGCTTIGDTAPPADWPKLEVVVHRVDGIDVIAKCYKYVSLPMKLLGSIPLACSEFNFAANRCDVWVEHEERGAILEHELEHCRGYDHAGSHDVADIWQNYKGH